jgi:hypothetical protein
MKASFQNCAFMHHHEDLILCVNLSLHHFIMQSLVDNLVLLNVDMAYILDSNRTCILNFRGTYVNKE